MAAFALGLAVGAVIMGAVAMAVNYRWYRECLRVNNDWYEHAEATNEKWHQMVATGKKAP